MYLILHLQLYETSFCFLLFLGVWSDFHSRRAIHLFQVVLHSVTLRSERMDALMVVHGDDFITLGDDDALGEVQRLMINHYTIKVRTILGAGRHAA